MAVDHYENFPVASLLCPAALRPAVVAIYRYARTADDIADEGDAPASQRLTDLQAFGADLDAVARGQAPSARWPTVFQPLAEVMRQHDLPPPLLHDLLSAFAQDVTQHHYADRAGLLDYCRRSANPIGRLLLHLYGVRQAEALRASDAICTALQLINFWQDLSVDTRRDRLYIPLEACERHGVAPQALLKRHDSPAVRRLVAEQVQWAQELMAQGSVLPALVRQSVDPSLGWLAGRRLAWELRLVMQGGLRILETIAARGHDSLLHRPTLRARDWLLMAWRARGDVTPALNRLPTRP